VSTNTSTSKRTGSNGTKDMVGYEFNGCVVLERAGTSRHGAAQWLCRCACGEEFVAAGNVIRKGDRKSCGCKDPSGRPAPKPKPEPKPRAAVAYWVVVERDGFTTLVRDFIRGDEALVEFQPRPASAWLCSECGEFPPPRMKAGNVKTAILTCPHIETTTRTMPAATALQIMASVAPSRNPTMSSKAGGAAVGGAENEKAQAVALAKSAIARAERIGARDQEYKRITGEVTVRTMSDEDRAKLQAARARKQRLVGAPDPL
jgi:hypothetical protein